MRSTVKEQARCFATPPRPPLLKPSRHESLTVVTADLVVPELTFESIQHLVSLAAGEAPAGARSGRNSLRDRLARALDVISGPQPPRG